MRSQPTPEDLARRVGRSGVRVRKLLRQLYPAQAPGSGHQWELSEGQVWEVIAYFEAGTPRRSIGEVSGLGIASAAQGEIPTEWYWEGHVQAVMVAHLRREGWTILMTSDTASRAQGEDIVASKGERRLAVEVKGYPSKSYRDPRRAGEVKPTNPTLHQALVRRRIAAPAPCPRHQPESRVGDDPSRGSSLSVAHSGHGGVASKSGHWPLHRDGRGSRRARPATRIVRTAAMRRRALPLHGGKLAVCLLSAWLCVAPGSAYDFAFCRPDSR
jgi:hypothetical protein